MNGASCVQVTTVEHRDAEKLQVPSGQRDCVRGSHSIKKLLPLNVCWSSSFVFTSFDAPPSIQAVLVHMAFEELQLLSEHLTGRPLPPDPLSPHCR